MLCVNPQGGIDDEGSITYCGRSARHGSLAPLLSRPAGTESLSRYDGEYRWVQDALRKSGGGSRRRNQTRPGRGTSLAFWVDDLREQVEKLKAAGVPILAPPMEYDTIAYGEPPGKKVLTCLFQDPDGIMVQFDQRMS